MIEFSAIWVQVTQVLPQLLLQWALAGLAGLMLLGGLRAGMRRWCVGAQAGLSASRPRPTPCPTTAT